MVGLCSEGHNCGGYSTAGTAVPSWHFSQLVICSQTSLDISPQTKRLQIRWCTDRQGAPVLNINEEDNYGARRTDILRNEYDLSSTTVNEQCKKELQTLLFKNRDTVGDSTGTLGYNNWVPHQINMTPNTQTIARQPHRMSPEIKGKGKTDAK